MPRFYLIPVAVLLAILAGCDLIPMQHREGTTQSDAVSATKENPLRSYVENKHYKIDIQYPVLKDAPQALLDDLHQVGERAKRSFIQGLPDPKKYPELANRQYQLLIDFTVAAKTSRFVSIREKGMQDMGGAHPIPIDFTFVYDRDEARWITPTDLFGASIDIWSFLSNHARRQLDASLLKQVPGRDEASDKARREWKQNMQKMIREGTEPRESNFSQFLILGPDGGRAQSIKFVFSPYQVAPYAYGTQTAIFSAKQLAPYLQPDVRAAFRAD